MRYLLPAIGRVVRGPSTGAISNKALGRARLIGWAVSLPAPQRDPRGSARFRPSYLRSSPHWSTRCRWETPARSEARLGLIFSRRSSLILLDRFDSIAVTFAEL